MTATAFLDRYGPRAIVAGASEGIGAAFATALAARGMNLVLAARREGPLAALAAKLTAEYGVEARIVAMDLAATDAADKLLAQVPVAEVGLLVYNAAQAPVGWFLDQSAAEHQRILDVNCRTPAMLIHALGREMAARGRGGLLLMSSMAGLQGSPLVAHYAATKAWALTLAEGVADELHDRGVDVLACCAGVTLTPGYLASRPAASFAPEMQPAEVAEEALAALPRGGSMVPGKANRMATAFMRLLPRRVAVGILSRSTRRMYAPTERAS